MPNYPIALFAFRRPKHTREVLQSLADNGEARNSDVHAFVDGPRTTDEVPIVEETLHTIRAFKVNSFRSLSVTQQSSNLGLAESVIQGVSGLLAEFPAIIVLEDDTVVSPEFLAYMNRAIDAYASDHRVWSISGHLPSIRIPMRFREDVLFAARASSWGYATWADRWRQMDWSVAYTREAASDPALRKALRRAGWDMPRLLDLQARGEIDSWAIRWCTRAIELGSVTAYPPRTLVHNIGLDGSGTHSPVLTSDNGRFLPLPPVRFPPPFHQPGVARSFQSQQLTLRRLLRSSASEGASRVVGYHRRFR